MVFWPVSVSTPHIIYAVLGAFIVIFGMFSLFLRERLYIGEAIWAFIFGVIIGPYCADIFNPRAWSSSSDPSVIEQTTNEITLEFTRVVLAIGVFAIGVELPKAYMLKHWKSLMFLLVPVMTWGWFVSAAFIFALVPGLNFLSSLAVAACLTPTDPILAAAVVGGKWADKHVPAHIRHLLAAESGCNDGAAFPFLYLALYLTIDRTTGIAVRDWFLVLWLYQVILGVIIGCFLGFGFRHLMKFCQRHDLIDRHSYVAQYVSLAMLTIGVTTLLGSDDLLAAFFCGTAFAWDGFFNKQTEESVFSSVVDTLFNIAAFIYVGAWMPFNKFNDAALTLSVWRLVLIALLVLVLRRLPVMMLLYKWIPDIKTFREAVFSGHFGPIGIGAVFISTLAIEILQHAREHAEAATTGSGGHEVNGDFGEETDQMRLLEDTIQPIVAFMVLCSITIHGLSIPGFSLGRRVHSVSRTWSRRDTMTNTSTRGGRVREPEWATQARRVTRAEDIVVNRDRDDMPRPARDVDLESGIVLEREKSTGSGSGSGTIDNDIDEEKTGNGYMAESGLSGDTRVASATPGGDGVHVEFVDSPGPATRIGTPDTTRPATPSAAATGGSGIGLGGLGATVADDQHRQQHRQAEDAHAHRQHPQIFGQPHHVRHPEQRAASDRDYAPDGGPVEDDGEQEHTVAEWIEGNQRVIETKRGPGSDVEVVVVDDGPSRSGANATPTARWQGKVHELEHDAEDIGRAISRRLSQIGTKKGAGHRAKETEEKGDILLSQAKQLEQERHQQERTQEVVPPALATVGGDTEEDSDAWVSDTDPAALSGSRAIPPRTTSPTSRAAKNAHARRGPPQHPKPTLGRASKPTGLARPGTADSFASLASNASSTNASPRVDASGNVLPPRNQRLENIRTGTHSSPGTRESSPSRNVRFVDYASQGRPGSSGTSVSASQSQQLPPPSVGAAETPLAAAGDEEDVDPDTGVGEERKGRSRSKRRFRRKGDDIV
uniref:Cation/H+ exchanger transmembrane domain-containing protein n=1 Tax=Psilocybe cubensis TaxID=181762 RepID=A0A8H7XPH3_PSICU